MVPLDRFCISARLVTWLVLLQPVSHRLGCLHHVLQLVWVWCWVALEVSLLGEKTYPQNYCWNPAICRSGTRRSEMSVFNRNYMKNVVYSITYRHVSQKCKSTKLASVKLLYKIVHLHKNSLIKVKESCQKNALWSKQGPCSAANFVATVIFLFGYYVTIVWHSPSGVFLSHLCPRHTQRPPELGACVVPPREPDWSSQSQSWGCLK